MLKTVIPQPVVCARCCLCCPGQVEGEDGCAGGGQDQSGVGQGQVHAGAEGGLAPDHPQQEGVGQQADQQGEAVAAELRAQLQAGPRVFLHNLL